MKNNMSYSIESIELSERYELRTLQEEWILISIGKGQGSFQSHVFIHEYRAYDCLLLPPEDTLVLVPEPFYHSQVFLITFTSDILITHQSDRSAHKMLSDFLNPSGPFATFTMGNDTVKLFEHYAVILLALSSNTLPYSIMIYQYTMNALLLFLARAYSIQKTDKKQASRELSSRLFMIESVKHYINQNFSGDLSLQNISNSVYTNPSYLSRIFKETTGTGLSAYINCVRIEKAKQLLLDTDDLIIDIAIACGYNYIPHFNAIFKEFEGMTPKQYRKGNKHPHY